MDSKDIGIQIKHLRHIAGITQKELAEKIGTTWEMVSRYETGKSSPLRKLNEIASALKTDMSSLLKRSTVEDAHISYQRNTIPLLTDPFPKLSDALKETKQFYTAPDWIIHSSVKPFAVDASLVTMRTAKINPNGVLFISSEKPTSSSELVLTQSKSLLTVSPASSRNPRHTLLGTVIAWEQRFR